MKSAHLAPQAFVVLGLSLACLDMQAAGGDLMQRARQAKPSGPIRERRLLEKNNMGRLRSERLTWVNKAGRSGNSMGQNAAARGRWRRLRESP
jgi:hypothetical protein